MNCNSLQLHTHLEEFRICDLSTDFCYLPHQVYACVIVGTGIFRYVEACVQLRNHQVRRINSNILRAVILSNWSSHSTSKERSSSTDPMHDRGEYLCRISLDHSMDPSLSICATFNLIIVVDLIID